MGLGEPEKRRLTLGFIPLTDCAPLVVALEQGFFAKYGLEVTLSRELSWATIRDKVVAGVLDGAHMLAAMPIATTLGLGGVKQATITSLSLDLNGNAITVSTELYGRMLAVEPALAEPNVAPLAAAAALRSVILADQAAGRPPLNLAMVFPYSMHNYVLRYWLAAAGIDPDRDVRLVVIPPPNMAESLRVGDIAGYCVGEPWNSAAILAGVGHCVVPDYAIWNNKPEKVFGVSRAWAEAFPNTHQAVLMALLEAAQWLEAPHNRLGLVDRLAQEQYINADAEAVAYSLAGNGDFGQQAAQQHAGPGRHEFFRYAATFPWQSHAVWLLTQMYRWGQFGDAVSIVDTATAVYRPDLYRAAADALGVPYPSTDSKREGEHAQPWQGPSPGEAFTLGPDLFCDGGVFDPADPVGYLRGFTVARPRVALDELARVNP